jgi:HK97 family phage prohead protease
MKEDYINNIEGAERRFISPNIEVREDEAGNGIVEGVAAVTESTTDLGPYSERIARGAFDNMLNGNIVALFNHDANFPLARSINGVGTLKVFVNAEGHFAYRYNTPNRTYAKDLLDAIRSKDVSKSSFAFQVESEQWTYADKFNGLEKDLRTITAFKRIIDVSPVTYEAYHDTSVGARSLDTLKTELKRITEARKDLADFDLELLKQGL